MFDSKKTLSALAFAGLMCAPAFAAAPTSGTWNAVLGSGADARLVSVTMTGTAYTGSTLLLSTGVKNTLKGNLLSGTDLPYDPTDSTAVEDMSASTSFSESADLDLPFNADAYVVKMKGTLGNTDYAPASSAKDRALTLAELAANYASTDATTASTKYSTAVTDVNSAYNSALATDEAVADKTIAKAVSSDDIDTLTINKESAASDVKDAEKDVAAAKDAFKAAKTSEKAVKQNLLSKANADLALAKSGLKTATADLTAALALQKKVVDKYLSTSDKKAFNSLAKLKADSETASKKAEAAQKASDSLVAARDLFKQQATQFVSVANGDEGLILVTGVSATGTSFSYSGPAFSTVVASKKTGDVVVSLNCQISDTTAATPENGLLVNAGAELFFSGASTLTFADYGIATDKMTFKGAVTSTLTADGPFGAESNDRISLKLSKGALTLTNIGTVADPTNSKITSSLTSNSGIVTGTVTINKKQVKVYGMAAKTGNENDAYGALTNTVSLIHSGIDTTVDF